MSELLEILQKYGKSYKELLRDVEYYTEEVGLGIDEAIRLTTKDWKKEKEHIQQ